MGVEYIDLRSGRVETADSFFLDPLLKAESKLDKNQAKVSSPIWKALNGTTASLMMVLIFI